MLNPGALWVRSLTGASVRMSAVPGVMSARAWLRNCGAIMTFLPRSGYRQPYTTGRGRVTRQFPGVHGNANPSQSLHVWHLCAFVDARFVGDLFLQYRKDVGRKIGRASCRERSVDVEGRRMVKKT